MWLSLFSSPRDDPRLVVGCNSLSLPICLSFAGDHGGAVIPVPIPNTEVKGSIAEGSVGPAHARVGRRRLFSFHSKSRRRPTAAPPLARPSGSASPRGIRRLFSFNQPPGAGRRRPAVAAPLATSAPRKLALRARGIRRLFSFKQAPTGARPAKGANLVT